MIATALAVLAASQISGPDRILPLFQKKGSSGQSCTKDERWCVRLMAGEKGPRPAVSANGQTKMPARPTAALGEFSVWPHLYKLEDGRFLAGVVQLTTAGYSGGGGSVSTLRLYEIFRDGKTGILPVLDLPIRASLMIRACFSQRDAEKRRGACHDEYGYSARLGLASGRHAAMPVLTYTSEAWSFPRGVRRSQDSTQMRALRATDLARQRDPVCSFSRQFRFDQEWGIYRSKPEMPDCGDYTSP
jgi:hypothetical protein